MTKGIARAQPPLPTGKLCTCCSYPVSVASKKKPARQTIMGTRWYARALLVVCLGGSSTLQNLHARASDNLLRLLVDTIKGPSFLIFPTEHDLAVGNEQGTSRTELSFRHEGHADTILRDCVHPLAACGRKLCHISSYLHLPLQYTVGVGAGGGSIALPSGCEDVGQTQL